MRQNQEGIVGLLPPLEYGYIPPIVAPWVQTCFTYKIYKAPLSEHSCSMPLKKFPCGK